MDTKQLTKRALTVIATVAALPVFGGSMNDWGNVEKLRPGDRIGIVEVNQKRLEGRFENANSSTITLDSGGQLSIRQQDVVRVYKLGASKKKRMLIGTAVGLAAGGVVAATVSRRLNNEGFFGGQNGGAGAVAAVGGGAGIGLAVGGLSGGGYQTIYQKQGAR